MKKRPKQDIILYVYDCTISYFFIVAEPYIALSQYVLADTAEFVIWTCNSSQTSTLAEILSL